MYADHMCKIVSYKINVCVRVFVVRKINCFYLKHKLIIYAVCYVMIFVQYRKTNIPLQRWVIVHCVL